MAKIVNKVKVEHPAAKYIFFLSEETQEVIHMKAYKGDEKVLMGKGAWIVTDKFFDILQGSSDAFNIDILDQDGFIWITDMLYMFGRKICKKSKKAFSFRIETDKQMQRAMSA